jgi:hypothetical protein
MRNTQTRIALADKPTSTLTILGSVIASLLLGSLSAGAQVAVMAAPASYATVSNQPAGNPCCSYINGGVQTYSSTTNAYAAVAPGGTIGNQNPGVPDSMYSYVVTEGNQGAPNGVSYLLSTVSIPANPPAPASPINQTVQGVNNISLGGLLDAFAWGSVDVVMNQCFGGGFAFNVAGSLTGAVPNAGGAVVAPANRIPYTFASAANFNEYGWMYMVPGVESAPNVATAQSNFTQGHAWAASAPTPQNLYTSYQWGGSQDPFTVNGTPYGTPNQILPPPAGIRGGVFESPVYASVDPPLGGGGVNPAGPNNSRGYSTYGANAAHSWAVLIAFTPNFTSFSVDIQRQFVALTSNGVLPAHIAILWGNGAVFGMGNQLPPFSNLNANNNLPRINPAGANLTVAGAASFANIQGLLNPALRTGGMSFWQALVTGEMGATPAAGDRLLLYTTGHGSAVNVFGAQVFPANGGNKGAAIPIQINLTLPNNAIVSPGPNSTGQIAVASNAGLGANSYQVTLTGTALDGVTQISSGPITLTPATGNTVVDVSSFLPYVPSTGLSYYDFSVPSPFTSTSSGLLAGQISLTISSSTQSAINLFGSNLEAVTFMDDVASNCGISSTDTDSEPCDFYTAIVDSVTLPSSSQSTVTEMNPIRWLQQGAPSFPFFAKEPALSLSKGPDSTSPALLGF